MRSLGLSLAFIAVGFLGVILAQDSSSSSSKEKDPADRIYQRLIPSDVLRDFPGTCFASTKCATFEPGASWDLKPFCGRSTCVAQQARLWELVEDCGPLPIPNPKCKLSDRTNKTADFPKCCPIFDCEAGVTLEYPDVSRPPGSDQSAAAPGVGIGKGN